MYDYDEFDSDFEGWDADDGWFGLGEMRSNVTDERDPDFEGISFVDYNAGFGEVPASAIYNERMNVGGRIITVKRTLYGEEASDFMGGLGEIEQDEASGMEGFSENFAGHVGGLVEKASPYIQRMADSLVSGIDYAFAEMGNRVDHDAVSEEDFGAEELAAIDRDLELGVTNAATNAASASRLALDKQRWGLEYDEEVSGAGDVGAMAVGQNVDWGVPYPYDFSGADLSFVDDDLENVQSAEMDSDSQEQLDDYGTPTDLESSLDSESMDADYDGMLNPEGEEKDPQKQTWFETLRNGYSAYRNK